MTTATTPTSPLVDKLAATTIDPLAKHYDGFAQRKLSQEDATAYAERLLLPADVFSQSPSLDLLTRVQIAHLEQIAKDTSPLHVRDEEWDEPNHPIRLSSNFTGMPESVDSFERIIRQKKGAFCFAINASFAAFLRNLDFRVSELVGRTFGSLGNDPLTHPDGWKWKTYTHELLVVDWEGSEDRWLVDGAWGPRSLSVPIMLVDGETTLGMNDYEGFQLRYEHLPLSSNQTQPIDNIKGWTLSVWCPTTTGAPLTLPISTSTSEGYWSPMFHFYPISISTLDFRLYHHFSASHELASFTAFWLVTKLIPGTGGARRSMMFAEKGGERKAKVYTVGGHEGKGSLEGRDVEWVEMETEPMKAYLKKEFGFGFP